MLSTAAHRLTVGILGTAMFAGTAATSSPAAAMPGQMTCGQRDQVVKMLQTRHDEAPVSMGLAINGTVVEVFSTDDGASWTLVMTMPDGRTCLMASGESWMSLTQVAGQIS